MEFPAMGESAANWKNPPTVVVVRVPVLLERARGLLLVRRALPDGRGKLALPGGFQEEGQTWQEAGAAEVLEETGVVVDPSTLELRDFVTPPHRRVNLLFCDAPAIGGYVPVPERIADWEVAGRPGHVHDWVGLDAAGMDAWERSRHEIEEVVVVDSPCDTAFPLHDAMVWDFFYPVVAR